MYRFRLAYVASLVMLLLATAAGFATAALTWQDVASELMSPACPGRTLINCTSGHAEQWRQLIRQKIARGETKEDILQYFVAMRGKEILAAPPKSGFALTAWILPIFVVINGAGLIMVLTYRWARNRPARDSRGVSFEPEMTSVPVDDEQYRQRLRRELRDLSAG